MITGIVSVPIDFQNADLGASIFGRSLHRPTPEMSRVRNPRKPFSPCDRLLGERPVYQQATVSSVSKYYANTHN